MKNLRRATIHGRLAQLESACREGQDVTPTRCIIICAPYRPDAWTEEVETWARLAEAELAEYDRMSEPERLKRYGMVFMLTQPTLIDDRGNAMDADDAASIRAKFGQDIDR